MSATTVEPQFIEAQRLGSSRRLTAAEVATHHGRARAQQYLERDLAAAAAITGHDYDPDAVEVEWVLRVTVPAFPRPTGMDPEEWADAVREATTRGARTIALAPDTGTPGLEGP